LSARGVLTAGFVSNPSAGAPFGLDRGFAHFHHLYGSHGGLGRVPRAAEFRSALRSWLAEAAEDASWHTSISSSHISPTIPRLRSTRCSARMRLSMRRRGETTAGSAA
jgi:hypothetical protein